MLNLSGICQASWILTVLSLVSKAKQLKSSNKMINLVANSVLASNEDSCEVSLLGVKLFGYYVHHAVSVTFSVDGGQAPKPITESRNRGAQIL